MQTNLLLTNLYSKSAEILYAQIRWSHKWDRHRSGNYSVHLILEIKVQLKMNDEKINKLEFPIFVV